MTKILLALLLAAPMAQAACTVYGDGFVTPSYILPGNDKADTVSALLGVELVEVGSLRIYGSRGSSCNFPQRFKLY